MVLKILLTFLLTFIQVTRYSMHGTVLVNGQGLSATTYEQSVLLERSMTRKAENISRNTSRQTFT